MSFTRPLHAIYLSTDTYSVMVIPQEGMVRTGYDTRGRYAPSFPGICSLVNCSLTEHEDRTNVMEFKCRCLHLHILCTSDTPTKRTTEQVVDPKAPNTIEYSSSPSQHKATQPQYVGSPPSLLPSDRP